MCLRKSAMRRSNSPMLNYRRSRERTRAFAPDRSFSIAAPERSSHFSTPASPRPVIRSARPRSSVVIRRRSVPSKGRCPSRRSTRSVKRSLVDRRNSRCRTRSMRYSNIATRRTPRMAFSRPRPPTFTGVSRTRSSSAGLDHSNFRSTAIASIRTTQRRFSRTVRSRMCGARRIRGPVPGSKAPTNSSITRQSA